MTDAYVVGVVFSLVAALAAVPVARRMALRTGLLDAPDTRKAHPSPVPYLGGPAMVVAFSAAFAVSALVGGIDVTSRIWAILAGALLVTAVGLWDDVRGVSMTVKLALELLLAVGLYEAGVRTRLFDELWPLDLVLTVGWIVGITNAVNLMDNMDGLTAGITAIAALYLLGLAADSGQFALGVIAASLLGAALGFLWHNRAPATIFMGDAGSLFLGFTLAAVGLELRFDNIEEVTFFVPVAILAVPILDTLMASVGV